MDVEFSASFLFIRVHFNYLNPIIDEMSLRFLPKETLSFDAKLNYFFLKKLNLDHNKPL